MQLNNNNQTPIRTPIVPPSEIGAYVEQGKSLILVNQDFDNRYVPKGYTKLTINTPMDKFIALVPQQALFYLDSNNLGNGSIEDGLEALSELYEEILAASDIFDQGEGLNAGGIDLAVTVRSNYKTLLTNSLLTGQAAQTNTDIRYSKEEIERLCLIDSYVDTRMKGIVAIIQGKSAEEIRASDLSKVLGFNKGIDITEHISHAELHNIATQERYSTRPQKQNHMTCTGESYFYLKEDLREGKDGWDYNLRNMTKTRTEITPEKLTKIADLENEIHQYQKKHSGTPLSPHDSSRTRQFMNIKYEAGLNIDPTKNPI